MNRKPNANDVAQLAQVSRAAVSLVLSGNAKKARISDETEARIRDAARELNYKPNAVGRSLASGRTQTIGLVIRDLALLEVDPYLLPLLNGIMGATRAGGYRVLIESASAGPSGDQFTDLLESGRIDGIIVENPDAHSKSLMRLIESKRPVVVMGTHGQWGEYSVSADDCRIGYDATHHLISTGRRKIGHIAYAAAGIHVVDQRVKGYRQALDEAGLKFERRAVTHANFSMESGYDKMVELLKSSFRPDAVFASSDAVAIGAMAAALDAGVRVPEDIAISSVDDITAARFCRPSLTTVTSEPYLCGKLAAEMLVELMSGRTPPSPNIILESQLMVRGSSVSGGEKSTPEVRASR
jgi:DNA-binding LacI/PurR family transcriptional regulator